MIVLALRIVVLIILGIKTEFVYLVLNIAYFVNFQIILTIISTVMSVSLALLLMIKDIALNHVKILILI